jgi:hypothetical protein
MSFSVVTSLRFSRSARASSASAKDTIRFAVAPAAASEAKNFSGRPISANASSGSFRHSLTRAG